MPAIPIRRMLEHWVCFDCRKMFRKPSRWEGVHPSDKPEIPKHICPQCRKEMRDMGKHFEPPRRNNEKLWKIMKLLSDHGHTFHCEGCKSFVEKFIFAGKRPNFNAVEERILKLRNVSDGEELLKRICRNSKSKTSRLLLPDVSGIYFKE